MAEVLKFYVVHLQWCRANKELLLNPVTICRNEKERILIEPSVNSVRVSIMIKQVRSRPRQVQQPCRQHLKLSPV